MAFESILFPAGKNKSLNKEAPACLADLHLDQFFGFIFANKEQYHLESHYYTLLKDMDTIKYRQEVLQDLLNEDIRKRIYSFSVNTGYIKHEMDTLRVIFSEKSAQNNYLSRGKQLYYALTYVSSVNELKDALKDLPVHSRGLSDFAQFLTEYQESKEFRELDEEAKAVRAELDSVHYTMQIRADTMRIFKYNNEENLTDEITSLFKKFSQESAKDYSKQMKTQQDPDKRIEIQLTNHLAKMFSKEFKHLDEFSKNYRHFDNDILLAFSNEIQFYFGWLEQTEEIRQAGLSFTFPKFCEKGSAHDICGFFDLMLAAKQPYKIVTNDLSVKEDEHILVITGPNQGGKTTYARAYGQLHYLASLGLDVPGTAIAVPLTEKVLTHFEKEETIETLNGKLQDELERLYELKTQATKDSLILINEIFASTTTADAIVLGHHLVDWLKDIGSEAIVVTFLDELATDKGTVSLMCGIESEENHERTYKIVRKDADGHAYAMDIAKKYGLTREELKRRLAK